MNLRWIATLLLGAVGMLRANVSLADDVEFFEAKVRPILVEHCQKCHGEKKQRGGLRLDTKSAWQKGGDSGAVLVPGKAERSLLIRMIKGGSETPPEMPPDSRLSDDQVAVLVEWINRGAPDPRDGTVVVKDEGIDWAAAAKFWAFQPVQAIEPPAIAGLTHPIDRFIAVKLNEKGLTPVGRADKRTLIRRATFTLIGLPPTRAEVEAFLADDSPDAFAKVVDRLLASPRYGEYQARLWLDVARYAEEQQFYPNNGKHEFAWRYRDWVIDAFNADLPYDRFVKYQIAADLQPEVDREPKHLAALGFFGLGPVYISNGDPGRAKAETIDDRVDTLTRGFLGLTVSCARCHDHKFDPIPTIDYYSLASIFHNTALAEVPLGKQADVLAYDTARAEAVQAVQQVRDFFQDEKDRIARKYADALPDYIVAVWRHHANKFDQPDRLPDADAKTVNLDAESFGRMMKYLGRNDPPSSTLKGLSKLMPTKTGPREPPPELNAVAAAFCLAVKKNLDLPLTKRNLDIQNDLFGKKGVFPVTYADVMIDMPPIKWNAVQAMKAVAQGAWERVPPPLPTSHGVAESPKIAEIKVYLRGNPYKFGELAPRRFLKAIAGDDRPAVKLGSGRRELADAIADPKNPLTPRVLVNRVWMQHFGQGIVATPSNFGKLGDRPSHPELLDFLADRFVKNGWSVKALHREMLLSDTFQRASTVLPKNQEIDADNRYYARMNRRRLAVEAYRDSLLFAAGNLDTTMGGPSKNVDDVAVVRRTVYGKVSRIELSQVLRLFDFPDANITSDRRTETTVPQQMLFAMNSPFAIAQAKSLAARVAASTRTQDQIHGVYWFALGRPATEAEIAIAVRYLETPDSSATKTGLSRLERFAQALLASNEFVYVD